MVRIVALSDTIKHNMSFNPPTGYKLRDLSGDLSGDYTIGVDLDDNGIVDNDNVDNNNVDNNNVSRLLWFKWKIKNRGSWAYIAGNIWFPLYVVDKGDSVDSGGQNKNDEEKNKVDTKDTDKNVDQKDTDKNVDTKDTDKNVDQKSSEIDEYNDVEDSFRTNINRIERRSERRNKHTNSQPSGKSDHPSKFYSRRCRGRSFKRTMTRNEVSRRRDTKYKISNLCIDCFYEKTVVNDCPECKKLRDEENYYNGGLCDLYYSSDDWSDDFFGDWSYDWIDDSSDDCLSDRYW